MSNSKFKIQHSKFYILHSTLIIFCVLCGEVSAQTITIKQHKHLYWLVVTIPSILVAENQWKYAEKTNDILNDKYSDLYHFYHGYYRQIDALKTAYKNGLYTKEEYEEGIIYWKDHYGWALKAHKRLENRYRRYLWYFGAASAVAVGSFVYAIIPSKVRIPVDLSVYPDGFNLSYNF